MILLLLACTAPPEPQDAVPQADTGAPIPGTERPDPEPVWDTAELESQLSGLLAEGFPNPRQAMSLYLEVMSHGDSVCPGNKEYIDATNLRGCTADSGYFYSGVSTYERQIFSDQAGNVVDFEGSTGDYLFRDPQGHEMEGGGHQTLALVSNNGVVNNVSADLSGSFVWEGHEGVYREKVSGSLRVQISQFGSTKQLRMQGAVGYLGHALYFETDLWEECGWRSTDGIMEIRDPSGGWYTLGPQSCESPCMIASFGGEERGEVCVELGPIAEIYGPELELLGTEVPQ